MRDFPKWSLTFKDDSTTEIKINLLPDKDAFIKLSGRLHKLFTVEQRKEALQLTTPLLRIETVDLSGLTPTTSDYQTTMLMHDI